MVFFDLKVSLNFEGRVGQKLVTKKIEAVFSSQETIELWNVE